MQSAPEAEKCVPVGDQGILPLAGGDRFRADASACPPEEYAGACDSAVVGQECCVAEPVLKVAWQCKLAGTAPVGAVHQAICSILAGASQAVGAQNPPQAALLAHWASFMATVSCVPEFQGRPPSRTLAKFEP